MVKPGYKQTEVGVIPEDWECAQLLDKATLLNGLTYTPDNVKDNGLLVLRSSNIQNSQLSLEDTLYVNCIVEDEKKIKDGDILICVRNGSAALIGKCAQVHRDYDATFGAFMAVLRGNHNDYIHQILQQGTIQKEVSKNSGATINQITNGDFKLIEIALPASNDEEVAIASSLSNVDKLISSLEKLITKKKAIKQGVMQELLTGRKRLPGFSGNWKSYKLNDLLQYEQPTKYIVHSTEYSSQGIPVLTAGKSLLLGYTAETDNTYSNLPVIIFDDFVTSSKFVDFQFKVKSSAMKMLTTRDPAMSLRLIYEMMQMIDFKPFDHQRHWISLFSNFEIKLPQSIDEQMAIDNVLSNMSAEIEALEQKLAKYRQVKQGMMQQLLTGKIRLTKDIEDSVQAEQLTSEKAMTLRPVHNHQFDDAVTIAAIVDAFYSDKYPLGRVKVQKLLYLLHRHQGVSVSDFKKKAAGPYADTVRYKGGEPIAKKNKYIVSESGKQGTRYSKGTNMGQALDYVERWGMQADLQWLKENFLHTSRNDLELFATVDMAMCDLDEVGISVSVESIKNLIASNKEWKAKLSKTYFSDWDIARAIKKCTELFN